MNRLFATLLTALLFPFTTALGQSTFTGAGDWLDPVLWDAGLPADNSTATVNGDCVISENIVPTQSANPGRVNIADGVDGSLTVNGGTLSGAHGSGGIFVGLNGGTGSLTVNQGATYRTQGAGMVLAVGDGFGGSGTVEVSGELQVYKFMQINNGTLRLMPTAICNKFNSADQSVVGAGGTLAWVIDGANVGGLTRANGTGLQITLDPASQLEIELTGDFAINDSWVLMDYTFLSGQFAQGEIFVNSQGYTFTVDYGTGANDVVTLTLTSDQDRPKIDAFSASPAAISGGQSSTLSWTASNLEALTLDPGGLDVLGQTMTTVTPTETTTYTLTADLDGVLVSAETTVVVDELPVINSFTVSDDLIAPGEGTDLSWDVSGAATVTISPAPGAVNAVASATVMPATTTTYTLTATNGTGPVTADVIVTVDALDAALTNQYDAGAVGQTSGALLDAIGTSNIDMTAGLLVTGITTPNTVFTAAMDRVNRDANTGGDSGDGYPASPITVEVWVSTDILDDRPQVVFETGAGADGTAIYVDRNDIRLMHATGGVETVNITVPTAQLNTAADAIQITAVIDSVSGRADLYAKGAGGGAATAGIDATVGAGIGRASLFVWSGFGGAIGPANLGGAIEGAPVGATSFKGTVHLLNIYGRALTDVEVQTAFERKVLAVPDGDADMDGLPDFWELLFFADIEGQDGTSNGDGDQLDNAAELAAGSSPLLADTDGDGLDDDVEVGLPNPTDPSLADTDGDWLTDGEEVNGMPASDPTLADTDADGFLDVFEVDNGSDPGNAGSLPGADAVGVPTDSNHSAGSFAAMGNLFPGADLEDVAFRLCADFSPKADGEREVIFETGGGTVGFSLVYEAADTLVLRSAGSGGNVVATVSYTLSAAELAAGDLDIVFSYDVLDDAGQSTIELFVGGVSVGSESAALGGDWTGTNGSAFGVASQDFAGGGNNTPLMGIAPENVAINFRKGLIFYRNTLFVPAAAPPAITDFVPDLLTGEVTVTWSSTPGVLYSIWESTDLENWSEITDSELADSDSTTRIVSPFLLGGPDLFIQVRLSEE